MTPVFVITWAGFFASILYVNVTFRVKRLRGRGVAWLTGAVCAGAAAASAALGGADGSRVDQLAAAAVSAAAGLLCVRGWQGWQAERLWRERAAHLKAQLAEMETRRLP